MTIKKIDISDDMKNIIMNMSFSQDGDKWIGQITEQLDRPTYVNTNKVLEALGGKWNRGKKGHVFNKDPRTELENAVQNDTLVVDNQDFYATPAELALYVVSLSNKIYVGKVLEPSAGEGALADALLEAGFQKDDIQTIELNPARAQMLRDKGYKVIEGDFLEHSDSYDLIVMNPPFSKNQAVQHIMHAWELLAPDGQILSIADAGITFRSDQQTTALRELINAHGGIEPLPASSFKESGTGVRTVLVHLWKEGAE